MNLRDLAIFVTDQMDDRLAECGIDGNQIIKITIYDRKLPPDDNMVWMIRPLDHKFVYDSVCDMLQRWINAQIVICYMNGESDRDLSIEIMGNGKGMMAI